MKNRKRPQRKYAPPKMNETLPAQLVQIEKAVYGGSFLAHVDGKAIFVPLVLPGETANVRITVAKRGYSTADLVEIVSPARERIEPLCRHFGTCGGCQYQHTDYSTQLALKEAILRETLQRSGVEAPDEISVLAGTKEESWHYRNRIRLAFTADGNPGYRSRRSNAVVPIEECPIAAPLLVRAALTFSETRKLVASQTRIEELLLFCDASESALLAEVFVKSGTSNDFDTVARAVADRVPELKGMEFATAARDEDDEQTPRFLDRWGEPFLKYRAAGFDYRVDNGAFFQVNRRLLDSLVDLVAADHKGALAWDLFAGVGLFARRLAVSFEQVIAVESSPLAHPGLKVNLHGTSGSAVQTSTLNFLRGRAHGQKPELIVADPPRAGLGPEVTNALAATGAGLITYVSCDPATLARDLRSLLSSGYVVESITLADLFPQTFHLETVVQLRRS